MDQSSSELLQTECLVACGSSRPKKLTVVLSQSAAVLRVLRGVEEKACVSLGGCTVSETSHGRVELALAAPATRGGGGGGSGSRKSPRWKPSKKEADAFVFWFSGGERDAWLAALSVAAASRKLSDTASASGEVPRLLGLEPSEQVRYLAELSARQTRFWEEKGLRQVLALVTTPGAAPEPLLMASHLLVAQSQLLSVKQAVLSFDLVSAAARLLSDASVVSHNAGCCLLLSVLLTEQELSSAGFLAAHCEALSSLCAELRVAKLLLNLLVLEEDNLPDETQQLLLRCLCNMSWLPDLRAGMAGSEVLLRYLRVCLSLSVEAPAWLLAVKLLGNLALLPPFCDALSEEFDVSDVLLNLYCAHAAREPRLGAALCRTLANVCSHPFIGAQVLQTGRVARLAERVDADGLVFAVLANVCASCESSVAAAVAEALVTMPVTERTFPQYVHLLVVLLKRCAQLVPLLKKHNIAQGVLQKYDTSLQHTRGSVVYLQMLIR